MNGQPAPERAASGPKQRRYRLLLVSAAPVLLAVAFAAKLLSVGYLGGQAANSFSRGDQAAVAAAASGMGFANLVERHKAPFAAADALVLGGDYAGARALFEAALADSPPADECKVRVNLVLAIERLADQSAGSAAAGTEAARLYREGLDAVKAAPPGCFDPQGDTGRANGTDGEGERLREAEGRLQAKADKLGSREAESGGDAEGRQPDSEPQQSQLDKLKESAKSAQRERNDGMQRDEYLSGGSSDAGADRPW